MILLFPHAFHYVHPSCSSSCLTHHVCLMPAIQRCLSIQYTFMIAGESLQTTLAVRSCNMDQLMTGVAKEREQKIEELTCSGNYRKP